MRATRALPGVLLFVAACAGEEVESGQATLSVAVAANFVEAHERLATRFERATGYRIRTSIGSSGQLAAQIANGAPFEIFLSADRARPEYLERAGLAVPGSAFTYALGRLALYGPGRDSVRTAAVDLRTEQYRRVAIANPEIAPYGRAAEQALSALGLREAVGQRLVRGDNIAQTLQFVVSGSAEFGFVALSQVSGKPSSSYWSVPEILHDPIEQVAILLERGRQSAAAHAFLAYLRSEEARNLIGSSGYGVPTAAHARAG